jgi:hypothetical protein
MLSKLEKKIKYQFLANKILKNIIFFNIIKKDQKNLTRVHPS